MSKQFYQQTLYIRFKCDHHTSCANINSRYRLRNIRSSFVCNDGRIGRNDDRALTFNTKLAPADQTKLTNSKACLSNAVQQNEVQCDKKQPIQIKSIVKTTSASNKYDNCIRNENSSVDNAMNKSQVPKVLFDKQKLRFGNMTSIGGLGACKLPISSTNLTQGSISKDFKNCVQRHNALNNPIKDLPFKEHYCGRTLHCRVTISQKLRVKDSSYNGKLHVVNHNDDLIKKTLQMIGVKTYELISKNEWLNNSKNQCPHSHNQHINLYKSFTNCKSFSDESCKHLVSSVLQSVSISCAKIRSYKYSSLLTTTAALSKHMHKIFQIKPKTVKLMYTYKNNEQKKVYMYKITLEESSAHHIRYLNNGAYINVLTPMYNRKERRDASFIDYKYSLRHNTYINTYDVIRHKGHIVDVFHMKVIRLTYDRMHLTYTLHDIMRRYGGVSDILDTKTYSAVLYPRKIQHQDQKYIHLDFVVYNAPDKTKILNLFEKMESQGFGYYKMPRISNYASIQGIGDDRIYPSTNRVRKNLKGKIYDYLYHDNKEPFSMISYGNCDTYVPEVYKKKEKRKGNVRFYKMTQPKQSLKYLMNGIYSPDYTPLEKGNQEMFQSHLFPFLHILAHLYTNETLMTSKSAAMMSFSPQAYAKACEIWDNHPNLNAKHRWITAMIAVAHLFKSEIDAFFISKNHPEVVGNLLLGEDSEITP